MNGIKAFNELANDRAHVMQRLADRQTERAATSGLSPEMKQVIDRLELLSQHDAYLDRLDAAAAPCRTACLRTGVASAAVAGLGAAAVHFGLGLVSAGGILGAGLGGLVACICAIQARDTFRVQRWAAAERGAHAAERAELEQRRQDLTVSERTSAEHRVRTAAQRSGTVEMTVMTQTEKDAAVALAAGALAEAEKAVGTARALLAADRQTLFATAPQRMRETWDRRAEECSSTAMMCVGSAALAAAGGAGLLFGTEAAAMTIGSLMVGGILAVRLVLKKWVPATVEKTMRQDIAAQLAVDEARLEPLRKALEAARGETGARYVQIADEAKASAPVTQPPVSFGGGEVTVGGVKLKRNGRA